MELLYLLIGVVLGGTIVFFAIKSGALGATGNEFHLVEKQLKEARSNILILEEKLSGEQENTVMLNRQLAASETNLKNLNEKLVNQHREIEELQKRFSTEFKNLANEILDEKSKKFTEQNKTNLNAILQPLGEKIKSFETKVEETNKENIARNSALKEQIAGLKELNKRITEEAENLTRALKGDNKVQGNWGEMILEKILEKSGLEKDREYQIQASTINEEGRRIQPDVIVNLPDNKNIIIDSKVSLVAYEKYVNADSKNVHSVALKELISSVRTHMKGLGEKKYQSIYDIGGLDFVLLFIPLEPAFGLVVQNDQSIFQDAYDLNIVIVSPTTLIASLRTIASIWKNEKQSRNAMEIARQSGDLYDKFVGFTEDLMSVGKYLESTQKSYEDAMNKLSSGRGNLIGRVEKIKKLGAKASKNLDEKLLK